MFSPKKRLTMWTTSPRRAGHPGPGLLHQTGDGWGRRQASGNGKGSRGLVPLYTEQGGAELTLQKAEHAHAVLQLGKALKKVLLRAGGGPP